MKTITDQYNRSFKVLRVSVINRCNLGCMYCTEFGDEASVQRLHQKESSLPPADLQDIITRLHRLLELETVRLTGGEPLLYAALPDMIRSISDMGIRNISVTTNGMLLDRKAVALKSAGLRSINISLDAMDPGTFFLVNKRDGLQKVLAGIDAALDAGLQVKLNAVILKSINDKEIIPLLEYAWSKSIVIRFLEVMAMGHLHHDPWKYFFAQHAILERISSVGPLTPLPRNAGSTSNYWSVGDDQTFGIIANESAPFCHDCNRLRIDSDGRLFGCLSNNHGLDVSHVNDEQLVLALKEALGQKQSLKFVGSELSMLQIGG